MAGVPRIDQLQNNDRCLALLRAITVAHRHAQRAQAASLGVSILVAALGVVGKWAPVVAPTTLFVGVLWAAAYAIVVSPWSGRYLSTSATLQEMFDVAVFGLPWNWVVAGDRVPEDEVSRLSRRLRGDDRRLRDYYLVANLPRPYDVLFCLEQNLAWGSRVRRRFAGMLMALVTLWCAVGIVVGIITRSTIGDLINEWLVPSLGLLLLCLDTYRAQVSVTRERARVLGLVQAAYEDPTSPEVATERGFVTFARQIQDSLFHMRQLQPRVPTWFFRRFHDNDRTDFSFKMHGLEAKLGSPIRIGP